MKHKSEVCTLEEEIPGSRVEESILVGIVHINFHDFVRMIAVTLDL